MKFRLKKGRLLSRTLPVFAWFAALAAVAVLFQHQGAQVDFAGLVVAHEQAISVAETGYIKSLPVRLYEEVKQGDTLAVVEIVTIGQEEYNSELIEAKRATARAELERLQSELEAVEVELEAEQADRNRDQYAIQRRLAVDLEDARLAILEVKTELEPARTQLTDMEMEVRIAEELFEDNAIESYEVQKIKSEAEIVRQKVTAYEELLKEAEASFATCQLRLDEYRQTAPMPAAISERLEPLAKAVNVQEKFIEELVRPRDTVVITAPFDGVVSNLTYKAGQAVMQDIPIMTVVKPTPEYVAAWVPQQKIRDLRVDMPVEIVSRAIPHISAKSRISHISPSMEMKPERMWRSPDYPEWGQVVIIPIQPGMKLVPNEIVSIKGL